MEMEIEAQNIDLHPRWKEIVEQKARKLERFSRKITQVRITLIHSRHHLLGSEQVRLWASLPNHAIRIEKTAPQMSDAIRAAFAAAEKEIKALREMKSGSQKKRGVRDSMDMKDDDGASSQ
jgi:ribosomal subunit interface protein